MKKFALRTLSAFAACCFVPAMALASGTVKGTVQDKQTGDGLVGASVRLIPADKAKRTFGAVARPPKGDFTVSAVAAGPYTLEVTYTGFKKYTKQVTVKDNEELNLGLVGLIADINRIEEVVVTGIGSRNDKSVVATAVTKIDAGALREQQGYSTVDQLMAGKVPGVQIQQSSGNVGGGFSFQVRGGGGLNGGDPLIFVDGVRVSSGSRGSISAGGQSASVLADLNMEDIESMEFLKGPAGAALYGSAAQGGVIIIKTKRAKSGQDYFGLDVTTVGGWHEQALEYSKDRIFSADSANKIFQTGPFNEFALKAEGRSGAVGYYLSYSNRWETGILENNTFKREAVRANISGRLTQDLSVDVSASYTWGTNERPPNDNNVQGWLANTILVNPLFTRQFQNPSQNELRFPTYRYINHEPDAIRQLRNVIRNTRINASVDINYTPSFIPGLTLHALAAYDGDDVVNDQIRKPRFQYPGIGRDGDVTIVQDNSRRINYDLSASYVVQITDELSSTTILGGQMFDNFGQSLSGQTTDFTSERVMLLGAGTRILGTGNSIGYSRRAGYFFREELSFLNNTYTLNLGFRQDYSTVIGNESNAIFYPTVGGIVRLDKLGILPEDINLFKLRVTYGQSGNLPGLTSADPLRWGVNRTGIGSGAVISTRGNPGIEPERVQEIEAGFDIEIDNKYGAEFTYIYNTSKNSIFPVPEAPSTGLPGRQQNSGGTTTFGFESRVYATPIRTRDTELGFNFIWNYFNEEITSIPFPSTGLYQSRVGFQRDAMFSPVVVGGRIGGNGEVIPVLDSSKAIVDPRTGQLDIRQFVGNTIPLHNGSFTVNFRFLKDFRFSAMADWKLDFFIFNNNREFQINATRQSATFAGSDDVNDVEYTRLQLLLGLRRSSSFIVGVAPLPRNTPEYQAALNQIAKLDPSIDANYVEPGDFLRIRELSLSYDASDVFRELLGPDNIRRIQFSVSARNVALFTKYSFDPEVNGLGYDFLTLQNPRTFTFRMDLGI